ncbi:MAG TPA: MlaD family protein [Smithella sp.]|nr:MlaD family protein [Smithella sp.]HRS96997.1 MlaD family protein [Smithella sp.]
MSDKSSKFLIGLFVIVGALMCALMIIWIGASDILMKGSLYAVYFDESVQGLQVDSAIKYRGVEIGKVQSIKVAPDYRLIEVVMKIDLKGDLAKHTVATLKTAGITGIVFIELDQIQEGDLGNSPKITFVPPYPVIPSRRSNISRLMADSAAIIQSIKEMDIGGISEQLKNTTKAVEDFLRGKKVNAIIDNLEATSANLNQAIAKISKIVNAGKVDQAVQETMDALSNARDLVRQAKDEITALNLKEKSARADMLLDNIEKKTKTITEELQDTSENLRITSENLQKLSDSLERNPSELIFSKPAPPRKPME